MRVEQRWGKYSLWAISRLSTCLRAGGSGRISNFGFCWCHRGHWAKVGPPTHPPTSAWQALGDPHLDPGTPLVLSQMPYLPEAHSLQELPWVLGLCSGHSMPVTRGGRASLAGETPIWTPAPLPPYPVQSCEPAQLPAASWLQAAWLLS